MDSKTVKDAFALYDKKGTGQIPTESLGDMLRAIGHNPTQAEVGELEKSVGGTTFDFDTFSKLASHADTSKGLGDPEDYIRGFQVFDKEKTGEIGVGELRYILTSLGEKLSDKEVDELLEGITVSREGNVNYRDFVKTILAQ